MYMCWVPGRKNLEVTSASYILLLPANHTLGGKVLCGKVCHGEHHSEQDLPSLQEWTKASPSKVAKLCQTRGMPT